MSSRQRSILVVDDDEVVLSLVSSLLRRASYQVFEAASGQECLDMADKNHPDLILLDVKLPDINGIEVLKQIKADPRLRDIFIVHLSAQKAPIEVKMEGLEVGADGYITQPVENHELLSRVRAFLRHKASLDATQASERRYRALFESNPEPMWIYDKATFQILAVNQTAIHEFKYDRDTLLGMRVDQLLEKPEHNELLTSGSEELHLGHWKLRKKNGDLLEIETNEQDIEWEDKPARVVLARDVTVRNRIERERLRQLEKFEREFLALAKLSSGRKDENRRFPANPLRQRAAEEHIEISRAYMDLLTRAVEGRVYKVDGDVSDELRTLAKILHELDATARDVIEIHCQTLRKVAPIPEAPRAQGFIDTGRLTLVELLGHLLTAYQQRAHGKI